MNSARKTFMFLTVTALAFAADGQTSESPKTPIVAGADVAIVETESGKVRGFVHERTYIYKGLPYAKAERFTAPARPDAWEGVRDCLAWGPTCPMMRKRGANTGEDQFLFQHDWGIAGEDCQRLNIWTPGINDGKKRPVMMWIHGGGYSYGSSQELPAYDGEALSKTGDVVMVSVNHRLNVLGFADLSSFGEKYKYSANASILDLVAALEWVRDNIEAFGGDPGNVTIFGQSGGGGKVSTLMSAPSAQGLFHRAVVQSGRRPRFQNKEITGRVGKAIVAELGLDASSIDDIQEVPYDELAAATRRAVAKVEEEITGGSQESKAFNFGLSPSQDGDFLPYASDDPRALALSADVPLMIGSTKNEFNLSAWRSPDMRNASLEAVEKFIDERYGDQAAAYIAAVKKAYPGTTKPTDLIDVDTGFRLNAVDYANLKSSNNDAPVFMYLFTWQSPVLDGAIKAVHCMELPFVFNNIPLWEEFTGGGAEAIALADKISGAWINFARHGNPNHKGLPTWDAYSEKNGTTMFFDNECSIGHHHDEEFLRIAAGEDAW
jgi:para-nitrobenzyl esterase